MKNIWNFYHFSSIPWKWKNYENNKFSCRAKSSVELKWFHDKWDFSTKKNIFQSPKMWNASSDEYVIYCSSKLTSCEQKQHSNSLGTSISDFSRWCFANLVALNWFSTDICFLNSSTSYDSCCIYIQLKKKKKLEIWEICSKIEF